MICELIPFAYQCAAVSRGRRLRLDSWLVSPTVILGKSVLLREMSVLLEIVFLCLWACRLLCAYDVQSVFLFVSFVVEMLSQSAYFSILRFDSLQWLLFALVSLTICFVLICCLRFSVCQLRCFGVDLLTCLCDCFCVLLSVTLALSISVAFIWPHLFWTSCLFLGVRVWITMFLLAFWFQWVNCFPLHTFLFVDMPARLCGVHFSSCCFLLRCVR